MKIIPEQVETQIAHLFPARMLLVPVSDEKSGNAAALVVESKMLAAKESEELKKKISLITGRYRAPKYVLTLEKFPETHTGKPHRYKIASWAVEAVKCS